MPRPLRARPPRRRRDLIATLRASRTLPRTLAVETRNRLYARPVFYSLILAALLVLAISAWPFTRAHLQAVAILQQVSGQPVPRLVADIVAEPVSTQDLTLDTEAGPVRARTYLPDKQAQRPRAHRPPRRPPPRHRRAAPDVLRPRHGLLRHPRVDPGAPGHQGLPRRFDLHPHHRRIHPVVRAEDRRPGRRHGPQLLGRARARRRRRPALPQGFQVRLRRRLAGFHGPRRAVLPHRRGRPPQRHHRAPPRARVRPPRARVRVRRRLRPAPRHSRRSAPSSAPTCTRTRTRRNSPPKRTSRRPRPSPPSSSWTPPRPKPARSSPMPSPSTPPS